MFRPLRNQMLHSRVSDLGSLSLTPRALCSSISQLSSKVIQPSSFCLPGWIIKSTLEDEARFETCDKNGTESVCVWASVDSRRFPVVLSQYNSEEKPHALGTTPLRNGKKRNEERTSRSPGPSHSLLKFIKKKPKAELQSQPRRPGLKPHFEMGVITGW